jgi:hypothetical protein
MLEIEQGTVVSGEIVGNDLVLETRGGTTINAGHVRGPQGIQGIQGLPGEVTQAELTAAISPIQADVSTLEDTVAAHAIQLSGTNGFGLKLNLGPGSGTRVNTASYAYIPSCSAAFTPVGGAIYKVTFDFGITHHADAQINIQIAQGASVLFGHGVQMVRVDKEYHYNYTWVGTIAAGAGTFGAQWNAPSPASGTIANARLVLERIG